MAITNSVLGDSPKIVFEEVLLSLLPKNFLDVIFPLLEEVTKNLLIPPPSKRSHSADAWRMRGSGRGQMVRWVGRWSGVGRWSDSGHE
jgi:hypothetical protein